MKCVNGMMLEQYKSCVENMGKPKSPEAQIRGWKSRRAGEAFERLIDASCEAYRRAGMAIIEKTPEPMAPIKPLPGGRFIAIFRERAQCDYKGVLRGGWSIAFEAKRTDKDRIYQKAVTERQAQCLGDMYRLGANCFVLVSIRMHRCFRVPWLVWENMADLYGRKYMTEADLAEFEVTASPDRINFLSEEELALKWKA